MVKQTFRNLRSKAKPWKKLAASRMAKNQTFPEKLLWAKLKDKQLGVRFYKQSILLGYIADFWCPCGIVVEVDGPCHNTRRAYDIHRDFVLKKKGIDTIRFSAESVINNRGAVVALILDKIKKRMSNKV